MTVEEFLAIWHNECPTLVVHTSGSTGTPKPLVVEKKRMEASALQTCRFLGLKPGQKALLCMSLDYIAGKMMLVRSIVARLDLIVVEPSAHPLRHIDVPIDFAAMVPMQVSKTLENAQETEKLKAIGHLIIGGGAIDAELEARLRTFPNAVWSTYGMTETLSHIALRRLNGNNADTYYTPFDGVRVWQNEDQTLSIDAPAVCSTPLHTNDIVEMAPDGRRFKIIGRKDNVICSGGIKIQIEVIEDKLRPYLSHPFIITKCKDKLLGEAMVLLTTHPRPEDLRAICEQHLDRYLRPRYIFRVDSIPTTNTQKPAREKAHRLATMLAER